jgi:hypothetical protein
VSCSHFGLMVRTAVRALKAHWIGPDEGEAHAVSVKLEIDRLLRLRAPTNEIVHRVAPTPENSDRANDAHDKRPFTQRSAAFSRPRWGIGLNHLPSNPITHRAQARAVSVPQDA